MKNSDFYPIKKIKSFLKNLLYRVYLALIIISFIYRLNYTILIL